MPKIREYERKIAAIQPGEFSKGRRAQADDVPDVSSSARVGAAFGDLLGSIGKELQTRQAQQESFEVQKALVQESVDTPSWYRAKTSEWNEDENTPTTWQGFTDFIKTSSAARQQEASQNFKDYSPQSQQALQLGMLKIHGGLVDEAIKAEAAVYGAYMKQSVENTIQASTNAVALDPMNLPVQLEHANKFIASIPGLSPQLKIGFRDTVNRGLHDTALEALYSKAVASGDPDQLRSLFDRIRSSDDWARNTTPDRFSAFLRKADQMVVSLVRQADGRTKSRIEGVLQNWSLGNEAKEGDAVISLDQVLGEIGKMSSLSAESRNSLANKVRDMRKVKDVYAALDNLGNKSISELVREPRDIMNVVNKLDEVLALRGQIKVNQATVESVEAGVMGPLKGLFKGSIADFKRAVSERKIDAETLGKFLDKLKQAFPSSRFHGSPELAALGDLATKNGYAQYWNQASPADVVNMYQAMTAPEKVDLPLQYKTSPDIFKALRDEGFFPPGKRIEDGTAINFTQYGYEKPGDPGYDTNSAEGRGDRNNSLTTRALALSPALAKKYGLEHGQHIYVTNADGREEYLGVYEDTSPQVDNVDVRDKDALLGRDAFLSSIRGATLEGRDAPPEESREFDTFKVEVLSRRMDSIVEGIKSEVDEVVRSAEATGLKGDLQEELLELQKPDQQELFQLAGKVAEYNREVSALGTAMINIEKQYLADPPGYLGRDEAVSRNLASWISFKGGREGAPPDLPSAAAAFSVYLDSLKEAAEKRGLRASFALDNPLPKAYLDAVKNSYAAPAEGQDLNAAAITLTHQAAAGEHWPLVARQLRTQVPPILNPVREFYSFGDLKDPKILALAEQIERDTKADTGALRAAIPDEYQAEAGKEALNSAIRGMSLPLRITFNEQGSEAVAVVLRAVFDGLPKAALGQSARTQESPVKAAKEIYDAVIGTQFSFGYDPADPWSPTRLLRIPREFDAGTVLAGLEGELDRLDLSGIQLAPEFVPDDVSIFSYRQGLELYLDTFAENHMWMTSKDEKSAQLFDSKRQAVKYRDGSPVVVPFSDVERSAEARRKKRERAFLLDGLRGH